MASRLTPKVPIQRDLVIVTLRVVLWLVPSIVVPFGYLLIVSKIISWLLIVISIVTALATIGYIDQRLSLHKDRIDPSIRRSETIHLTIFFVLIQIVLGPMMLATVVLGVPAVLDLFR